MPNFRTRSCAVSGAGTHTGTPRRSTRLLRVAFVPWRGEHDHRLAVGRELEDVVRHGQWVEQEHASPLVDRVRRHLLWPRLAWLPVRVRRLPVPEFTLELAHVTRLRTRRMRIEAVRR
jgi:hypothetical protein